MMSQAIRQTTFVQPNGRIEIQSAELPQGAKVEVIVILEENPEVMSAEALAISRLEQLSDPNQWITVIEADREIDENELREWVASSES